MASSDQVVPDGRRYGEHRPDPDPPARLTELTGPTEGLIELPITIDRGPKRVYDMGREAERRIVYERVLREAATPAEVARYVTAPYFRRNGHGCFSRCASARSGNSASLNWLGPPR